MLAWLGHKVPLINEQNNQYLLFGNSDSQLHGIYKRRCDFSNEEIAQELGKKLVGYGESSNFLFRYISLVREMVALGEISPEAGDLKRISKWAEAVFQARSRTWAVLCSDSVGYEDSGLGCSYL